MVADPAAGSRDLVVTLSPRRLTRSMVCECESIPLDWPSMMPCDHIGLINVR